MVFVVPVGVPLWYLLLLWRYKDKIFPNNNGRVFKVQAADAAVTYQTAGGRPLAVAPTAVVMSGTYIPEFDQERSPVLPSPCTVHPRLRLLFAVAALWLMRPVLLDFVHGLRQWIPEKLQKIN